MRFVNTEEKPQNKIELHHSSLDLKRPKVAQRSDLAEDWSENAIASGRQQSHHQSGADLESSSQNQRHLCHDFKDRGNLRDLIKVKGANIMHSGLRRVILHEALEKYRIRSFRKSTNTRDVDKMKHRVERSLDVAEVRGSNPGHDETPV
ncbi:unnamed protein product [Clavelina lepadiformis]|uniref:Uncharacterized protein n=1 Tax=Clavelina lepadiformis TaxID=159417 RepID=A0ABP0G6F4_CLALP